MQELADVLGITVQRLLGLEENHPSVEETMDAVTVVAKGTEKKGVLIRDLILLTGVAVVDIFFLGGSIIFFLPIICAVVGVILYGKRALLYKIFSLVYCLLPILLAIHDMLSRIKGNDIGGVMDIDPYMSVVYWGVTVVVIVINLVPVFQKNAVQS